jgi:signal transduction histidine kinase
VDAGGAEGDVVSEVQFKTRARTIDHLGQNQIADCPTAISELWKNAYDAYARDVALHLFEGDKEKGLLPMAAIVDNGHGMSREEFIDRWLVVGTDSKAAARETPEEDRFGLPPRVSQGAKGIGRLSVAKLGTIVLVISKRKDQDFVASLIEWRVFENPYLMLEDVIVPVESFTDKGGFWKAFERMRNTLSENVWPVDESRERTHRLRSAWKRHDEDRVREGRTRLSDDIAASVLAFDSLTEEKLAVWLTWTGASPCGMALFVLNIGRELEVWVNPSIPKDDDEVKDAKELLEDTLISFVDPYVAKPNDSQFRYMVVVHAGGIEKRPVRWDWVLSLDEVRSLEHVVEGTIDEAGVFSGNIRAFGVDLGSHTLPPSRRVASRAGTSSYVGPYKILAATFEQMLQNSSLQPSEHDKWIERTVREETGRAGRFGGFAIYRDGLRVMPYGRARGDMFEFDERRGLHQGREFWAYKRTVGRISIARAENPNLMDKAGREGLVDNHARREFKLRVIDLFKTLARRFFGTDAPERDEKIEQANERHQAALKDAGKRSRTQMRAEIRKNTPQLAAALNQAEQLLLDLNSINEQNPGLARSHEEAVSSLRRRRTELAIAAPPRKLSDNDEDLYRTYRNQYNKYREKTDAVIEAWTHAVARAESVDPVALATKKHEEHRSELALEVHRWRNKIQEKLNGEVQRIASWDKQDTGRFAQQTSDVLVGVASGQTHLDAALSRFEAEHETLRQEFVARYEAYTRALDRLIEGVDVEGALRWSSDEIEILKGRVAQIHSLAQLGVTVEIVQHELHDLDSEVRRGLSRMPREVQTTAAFKLVKHSHLSLAQYLRFLTQLKLSGPRLTEKITGKEIGKYMGEFFAERLKNARAELVVTETFEHLSLTDFRSRIYPVFINLINNALYWLTFAEHERRIQLDLRDTAVIVADTGRGVDPDDVSRLFELFFTRRVEGRGVGLYLCRENLGAGGHTIEYAQEAKLQVLPGANFVIRFRGAEYV